MSALAPLSPVVCRHCGSDRCVRGDGPFPVCPQCVAALGRIAAEPYSAHVAVRARLEAAHRTAVALVGDRWDWIAAPAWPGVGDGSLVGGGRA